MRRTQCQDWLTQVNTLTDTQRVEVLDCECAEDDPEIAAAKLDLDRKRHCPYDRKFYLTLSRFRGGSVSLEIISLFLLRYVLSYFSLHPSLRIRTANHNSGPCVVYVIIYMSVQIKRWLL